MHWLRSRRRRVLVKCLLLAHHRVSCAAQPRSPVNSVVSVACKQRNISSGIKQLSAEPNRSGLYALLMGRLCFNGSDKDSKCHALVVVVFLFFFNCEVIFVEQCQRCVRVTSTGVFREALLHLLFSLTS